MKPAGYWPCYNEIITSALDTPRSYEPFTDYFKGEKLDEIRDHYGVDLYRECYFDGLAAVVRLANPMAYLRMCGVKCDPVYASDDSQVDYLTVSDLGNLTKERINQIVENDKIPCIFQA